MSAQTRDGADRPDDYPEKFAEEFGDDDPSGSRWPFLVALIVVGVLVAVVLLIAVFSPPAERVSDSTRVQYVVNDAFTARNSLNYDQYRGSFCRANVEAPDFPAAAKFTDENRKARDADGQIVIPNMDVEVQGDTARVAVHWHRERTEDKKETTELTVVKQGDDWKVCNS
ncbi:MAG: hypothetical protein QM809_02055 [Gordonia sp. (in: high G+C Gram-positive bacteria)]|uniref:Rv0361 family membrane protein n=1 Tax=Gordonia sp. (in: high G+C Gram-positive bacteria) TaxID=84139 RepID=UPI0039E25D4C